MTGEVGVRWQDLRVGQRVNCQWEDSMIEGQIVAIRSQQPPIVDSLYLRAGMDVFPVYSLRNARITVMWSPKPEEPRGLGAVVESVYTPKRQWIRLSLEDNACWVPTSGTLAAVGWGNLPESIVVRAEGWLPEEESEG